MQVTPLSQLFTFPPETPVPLIAGTLTNLTPYKTGTGQYGQWSFQNADLNDGQSQIRVTFKDRPQINQALIGRRVYISSTNGNGLKTKDDFNKQTKQTQRVAWVTGTAVMEVADGNGQQAYQPVGNIPTQQNPYVPPASYGVPPSPYPQPPYAPAPQVALPPVGQLVQRGNGSLGPKSVIGRLARIHLWCVKAAIHEAAIIGEEEPLVSLKTDNVLQVAACLFIDARKQLGLDGVPNIFDPKEAKAPTPYTPPPTAPAPAATTEDAPW